MSRITGEETVTWQSQSPIYIKGLWFKNNFVVKHDEPLAKWVVQTTDAKVLGRRGWSQRTSEEWGERQVQVAEIWHQARVPAAQAKGELDCCFISGWANVLNLNPTSHSTCPKYTPKQRTLCLRCGSWIDPGQAPRASPSFVTWSPDHITLLVEGEDTLSGSLLLCLQPVLKRGGARRSRGTGGHGMLAQSFAEMESPQPWGPFPSSPVTRRGRVGPPDASGEAVLLFTLRSPLAPQPLCPGSALGAPPS